ncbi:MAG: S9 family peptidase, partial [Ferruginibacter sp.]
MYKNISVIFFVLLVASASAQEKSGKLTVEKIMRDPKWMGSSPSNPFWGVDGNTLYFQWNPDKAPSDSTYFITKENKTPQKATIAQKQNIVSNNSVNYNIARTLYTYGSNGDIFLTDVKAGKTKRVTQTIDFESNPDFSFNETKIVY